MNDKRNPKDIRGLQKVSITKIPFVALCHEARAMMYGADQYEAYNWRSKSVVASIYIDACIRHLGAWFEGQELASDSGVHHLGHARACLGILLDALETGNLIDDRPDTKDKDLGAKVLDRLKLQQNKETTKITLKAGSILPMGDPCPFCKLPTIYIATQHDPSAIYAKCTSCHWTEETETCSKQ